MKVGRIWGELPDQHHFSHLDKILAGPRSASRLKPVKIDAAWNIGAGIVVRVPADALVPGGLSLTHERTDFLSEEVINPDDHPRIHRESVLDLGGGRSEE